MKFSSRIIIFTISCVVIAVLLVLLGGAFTFRQLAFNQQQHQLRSVVEVLDNQLSVQPDTPEFAQWLPNWLRAHNIQVLEVANRGGVIYTFRELNYTGSSKNLIAYRYPLLAHPEFYVQIWVERPFKRLTYEPEAMLGIGGGLLIVALGLIVVFRWLKQIMYGAELLQTRGNQIIAGRLRDMREGSPKEWPNAASKALELLIDELIEARQERSRFDCIIRNNAFVDELTQLSNRTHFLNQLEAEISDADAHIGAVLLIYLRGMDDVNYQYARSEGDAILQQSADVLKQYTRRNIDVNLARYSGDSFALLMPLSTLDEAEDTAAGVLKLLERISLPEVADADDFFYIGIAGYQYGDDAQLVLEQAEDALRIAQIQRHNGWYVIPRELNSSQTGKGSVRWRTLLQHVLVNDSLHYYQQDVFDEDGRVCYKEMLARITDYQGEVINAGVFLPWAEKSGLLMDFDRHALAFAMKQVKYSRQSISVNLNISTVLKQSVMRELLQWVFSVPYKECQKLVLEFHETQLSQLNDTEMMRLKALNKKGIKLAVERAGQRVVSTQYISELKLEYLKLHPSLVRDIQLRQVNQLAVSSMLASCAGRVKVVALGVERNEEWRVLQRLGVHYAQGFLFSKPEPF
ncbi:EAL domain-containing protein [Agarivorans gilvus]|uniref:RNase E specificity factor CsrD n=1 Tax=Agarivorans gilvus TaxID=680279 RepID=A0ABQ1HZ36_9ALTE|nr:EAL domain-containing protein [Agarivorans gilvus]GGA96070.1 RNase E specificity factor CsrD [Agarivorans gilvus]